MHYKNNYYRSKRGDTKKKKSLSKAGFIAIFCTLLAIASYVFFSPKQEVITTVMPLSIPALQDISIQEKADKPHTETLLSEVSPPKLSTLSVQNLSTIWQEYTIKSGESLSAIFSKHQLSQTDLYHITHANKLGAHFADITPGKTLLIGHNISGQLSHLIYKKNAVEELKATRQEGHQFKVESHIKEIEYRTSSATGVIHSSLFLDGKKAGLSDKLIMQLANLFAWDIDFALNLRAGDQFSVIYQEHYINGKFVKTGDILTAEFINQGRSIKTIRYQYPTGKISYYSPKGNSIRKAFLRTPIDFARISSHFNLKRKHPVLNRIRAHKGVDYAANTGTPIKASGDGKIIFRGRKGGYGNVVILKHGQRYSTLYAHMSKFKRGQRVGSRVHQGDFIGYVGKTGLASGPHLHYEFRVNGVHRNPLTVKLPNATPIERKYKADFLQKSKLLLAQLEAIKPLQVANTSNEH